METITTFQCVIHRRGETRVPCSKRVILRRLVGSHQMIELTSGKIITHWIHSPVGRGCRRRRDTIGKPMRARIATDRTIRHGSTGSAYRPASAVNGM